MSYSREKIAGDFAREIFQRDFTELKLEEKWFVFQHLKEYEKYRQAILERLTGVFQVKGGSQCNIIREWYYQRVPVYVVLRAIDSCLDYLRRSGKPLLSLKYFQPRVQSEFNLDRSMVSRVYEGREKWLWKEYQEWKGRSGGKTGFDFFEGEYRHSG